MVDLNIGFSTVLAQTTAVSQVAGAAQDHPEIAQSVAQEASLARLRKERKEIQKSEKSALTPAIGDDDEQEEQQAQADQEYGQEKEGRRNNNKTEDYEDNPWAGNIVNRRI